MRTITRFQLACEEYFTSIASNFSIAGVLLCLVHVGAIGWAAPTHSKVIETEPKHVYDLSGMYRTPTPFDSPEEAFSYLQSLLTSEANAPNSMWCSIEVSGLRDGNPGLLLSPPWEFRWDQTNQLKGPNSSCLAQVYINTGSIIRTSHCPPNYTPASKVGADGKNYGYCSRAFPDPPMQCANGCGGVGNPINKESGGKSQVEIDFSGPTGLRFSRNYSSLDNGFSSSFEMSVRSSPVMTRSRGCIPGTWTDQSNITHSYCFPIISTDSKIKLGKPGLSKEIAFDGTTLARTSADVRDNITRLVDAGTHTGWLVHEAETGNLNRFSATGRLEEITLPSGQKQQMSYTNDLLMAVTDHFGRSITFSYNSSGQLSGMTDPAGGVYSYGYDNNGNLATVTYPDSTQRTYHYESAPYTHALTGITDENLSRFATYGYGAYGRASSTEHAGGVNKYTIDYSNAPHVLKVTDPLLTQRTYNQQQIQGAYTTYSTSQPCSGAGCGNNATEDLTFDANGNIASRKDFNGFRTCFVFDLTRNLETFRAEGMGASSCPVTLSSWAPAVGTTQRKLTTTWHPTWRLTKQIAEPKRITTFKYHGESGVSCAPPGASTQLLCEKRVDATTDANGGSGMGAALDPSISARVWSWTYNVHGQVLTATDPRNNVTTYAYHPNTTALVTQGDLASVTTPSPSAGQPAHVTQFTAYDGAGRLKRMVDANGLETSLSYWPRGWLQTRTVGSNTASPETTQYFYDNVGQLTQVTQPDGSFITYTYDNAHRLEKVQDSQGNSITYTLDNMGNRKLEEYKDGSNQLSRKVQREYDALNRLKFDYSNFDLLAPNNWTAKTEYQYDNQGYLKKVIDPLNRETKNDYDALGRLIKVTEPKVSTETVEGFTEYGYDGQNNLKSVKDPKGLTTTYTYNGLGDLAKQESPDTGITTFSYDLAGNLRFKTDDRTLSANDSTKVTVEYTYDSLNRVKTIIYPAQGTDSAYTVTYTYDTCTNGKGRLCGITDKSGITAFAYDIKGRVTGKSQTDAGLTQTVGYDYYATGQLKSVTYPSGRVVDYEYENNRPILIKVDGKTLLDQAVYEPFGPIGSWTWRNDNPQSANTHLRVYDFDYRAKHVSTDVVGGAAWTRNLSWNDASAIIAIEDPANAANNAVYDYDELYRLVSVKSTPEAAPNYSYSYDLNGNRKQSIANGVTSTYSYPNPFTSHRLMGVSGAQPRVYAYDNVGNVTSDGVNTWKYGGDNRPYEINTPSGTVTVSINALGQRIKKTSAQGTLRFVYDEAGHLISEYDTANATYTEHVWLDDLPVSVVKTTLKVVSGDTNGDKRGDIIWRNATTGQNWLWLMNGLQMDASLPLPVLSDLDWVIAGYGDLDGDGKSDILWRNTATGQHWVWLLNGTTILNQGSLTSVAPPWQIQGLADFNGDGKADVLWRNPVTGQNWLWLMNGMTLTSSNALPTVPDPNWSIGALGDIDGDGLADVVWKNTTTGNHWLWRMNGGQIVSQTGLNAVDPNWQIELGGDLNADGKMDLVLRNTQSKQVWVWLMNDAVIQDQGPLASAPDATWILANGVDLNADGKRDLVWRQGTNSAVTGTLMNGLTGQGGTILSPGPGADWRIVPEANRTGGQGKSLQKADALSDRVMRILPPTKAENGPPQLAPAAGLGLTLPRSARETADFRLAMKPAREAPGMPWFDKGKGPNTGKVAKAGQWVTEVYHVHTDHLGTPRAITRPSDNQVVWKWDNTEPFGNNPANENPSGLGAFAYNLRHPGQYADQETGTFYNYFRDYDPALGRYRQSDPVGLEAGLNTFAYVFGNPLLYTDPDGLKTFGDAASAAINQIWREKLPGITKDGSAKSAEDAIGQLGAHLLCEQGVNPYDTNRCLRFCTEFIVPIRDKFIGDMPRGAAQGIARRFVDAEAGGMIDGCFKSCVGKLKDLDAEKKKKQQKK